MYENGEGAPQDDSKVMEWLESAANQGHVDAQFNLAVIYDKGERLLQDYPKAMVWYLKAAFKDILVPSST